MDKAVCVVCGREEFVVSSRDGELWKNYVCMKCFNRHVEGLAKDDEMEWDIESHYL